MMMWESVHLTEVAGHLDVGPGVNASLEVAARPLGPSLAVQYYVAFVIFRENV